MSLTLSSLVNDSAGVGGYGGMGSAVSPYTPNTMPPIYTVRLTGTDELGNQINVVAACPDNLQLNIDAQWRTMFPGGGDLFELPIPLLDTFANSDIGKLAHSASTATGYTSIIQALTQLVWHDTSPVEIRIPLQFNVVTDPISELYKPVCTLLKLICPSTDEAGMLRAPGPTLAGLITTSTGVGNGAFGQYKLQLQIGGLTLPNVIVKNVYSTLETVLDNQGHILSAQVDVSFSTTDMVTKADIDQMFGFQPNGDGSPDGFTNNAGGNLYSIGSNYYNKVYDYGKQNFPSLFKSNTPTPVPSNAVPSSQVPPIGDF